MRPENKTNELIFPRILGILRRRVIWCEIVERINAKNKFATRKLFGSSKIKEYEVEYLEKQNPARGRKLLFHLIYNNIGSDLEKQNPARGRKQCNILSSILVLKFGKAEPR